MFLKQFGYRIDPCLLNGTQVVNCFYAPPFWIFRPSLSNYCISRHSPWEKLDPWLEKNSKKIVLIEESFQHLNIACLLLPNPVAQGQHLWAKSPMFPSPRHDCALCHRPHCLPRLCILSVPHCLGFRLGLLSSIRSSMTWVQMFCDLMNRRNYYRFHFIIVTSTCLSLFPYPPGRTDLFVLWSVQLMHSTHLPYYIASKAIRFLIWEAFSVQLTWP